MKEGDKAALDEARLEAQSMLLQLNGDFRRHLVRPAIRLWHQASLYSTLEMVADASAALGDDDEAAAASLGACLSAIKAVSPGSDLHVQLAARTYSLARQRQLVGQDGQGGGEDGGGVGWEQEASRGGGGRGAVAVADAERRCEYAHVMRYGRGLLADEDQWQRLVDLSTSLALGDRLED